MITRNNIYNMDNKQLFKEMFEQGYDGAVDMVLTDPPYGINYAPNRGTFETIENDNLEGEVLVNFLKEYFTNCYKLLKDDSFMITFMGWSTIPEFNKAILESGFTIKSMPIWLKNNFGMGYYTRPQYEPMYLCFKGNPKPPKTPISDVIKSNKVQQLIHSCQKPIDLLSKLINTFSNEGDLVFDGFGGSFSTCVACKKTGRDYISCEIDPQAYENGKTNLELTTNQVSIFD